CCRYARRRGRGMDPPSAAGRAPVNLRASDYFLCRLAHRAPGALKLIGDMETDVRRSRLDRIAIDRPIFITGLARSGTTILLDLFSRLEPVGTHRYRDFPF